MKFIFDDPTFSYETLRTMSYAPYGGADIGEVLATAGNIESGNFESWYQNWLRLADQMKQRATEFAQAGDQISASENNFKASNYYRTAEFFLHGNPEDKRILTTWRESRDAFQTALRQVKTNVELVNIPYEQTTMPAYFYKVDDCKRPTLIVQGGFDSTSEELYFQVVVAALKRGFNCITFDGPGQGEMIREQHVTFRPDWENVIGRVVDFLVERSEVDITKIALMGISFGGFLAPRAAAFDQRIAAVMADDGLFSFQFSSAFKARSHGELNLENVDQILKPLMAKSTQVRWTLENGQYTFGADSIADLFDKTEEYTLANVVDQISCPVLVCKADADIFFKGQPELLFDGLTSPKTFMAFGKQDYAEEHCHMGGLTYFNQKMLGWLEETLK